MKHKLYTTRVIIASLVGILSILAFFGAFYGIHFLEIEFTPLAQRLVHNFSISALVLFIILVLIALITGRIYCSCLCPYGILQEFLNFVYKKINKKIKNTPKGNFGVKYLISALCFGSLIGGSAVIIRYIDPYTLFGSIASLSILGIIVLICIPVLVFFKNRFFCANICPVGAFLGLISKLSFYKMQMNENCVSCGMCARNCPTGAIDFENKKVDNEICVKCFKCTKLCPKGAMKLNNKKEQVSFSIKRRKLLWGISSLVVLGAALKAGITLSKELGSKIKNVILPAGAKNANKMLNKCLNCNLCIENCPNGILSKANEDFQAVHIDYSKGEKYCRYNCHKCSEVCPSGAIEKITLGEKQKTRIAMASISKNCSGCRNCLSACPVDAIYIQEGYAKVDGSKCIGCGKCATKCYSDAIEIHSINEQKTV